MRSTRTMIMGPRSMAELHAFEQALTGIADEARARVGAEDARYITRVLHFVRITETLGRALLMFGWFPPTWLLGACLLGLSKIVENMELGHNVMHGQFNWMNDPRFHGDVYDWDNTCPKEEWRHSHNYLHHQFTNVIGKDRDFGYGLLRLSADLRWSWLHPFQLPLTAVLAGLFEWLVAIHDMQIDKVVIGRRKWSDLQPQWTLVRKKMARQIGKDYVMWPLVGLVVGSLFGAGRDVALAVLWGNVVANLIRNVWAWAIIFCGHFTDEIYTFSRDAIVNETRGQWYLRQILGSSNIKGGKLMHFLSGNLSHQVEHHLFPDLPAHRYKEIAPQVQAVCKKYNVPYNVGYFVPKLLSVLQRIARYSLPGGSDRAVTIMVERTSA
ncbi:hypothetical protein JY96_09525 [Aquabacterium sp. NJ1]|uniref:fatty acid desaturase family protein n=1 Tax=Aquabacterium sp. NJ1 TaxID=1538295 RepID=UPI00052DAAFB|nr:acyl-CoA desaturase [Aquabacterium sp. NJ1]KGM40192.1 hypothetical protein JY96_09525 [Aquabacterium sp. NJ1]